MTAVVNSREKYVDDVRENQPPTEMGENEGLKHLCTWYASSGSLERGPGLVIGIVEIPPHQSS